MEQLLERGRGVGMWTYAIFILALGAVVGWISTYFAGASAGAFDASAIDSGDTAWILAASALILKVLSWMRMPLRVTAAEEEKGLDLSVHGEPGYQM